MIPASGFKDLPKSVSQFLPTAFQFFPDVLFSLCNINAVLSFYLTTDSILDSVGMTTASPEYLFICRYFKSLFSIPYAAEQKFSVFCHVDFRWVAKL